ncbi:hypothetical protein LguiA_006639 [Lonicera macranthoides]
MKNSTSVLFVTKMPPASPLVFSRFLNWSLKVSFVSKHTTILCPTFFNSSKSSHLSMKTIGTWLELEFPGYKEEPVIEFPFPRVTFPRNSRSIVPAATVSTQGVPLCNDSR